MKKNLGKYFFAGFLVFISFVFADEESFILSGEGKMRLRYVKTDADEISGAYGEGLIKGLSLRQRIDLGAEFFVTDYLSVMGTLRISNEDSAEMLAPPDLVSTRSYAGWWSANFYKSPFSVAVGSYEASFTPLTLMRWDDSDNPLGASGCGCQVAVGGLSGESLEEIGTDYRLEGGQAKYESNLLEATVLFARPEVAREGISYGRYVYGGRTRFILPYTRHSSALTLGFTGLSAVDDHESVEQALTSPLKSDVLGADVTIPLIWKITGVAEYARSIRDDNVLSTVSPVRSENGIVSGLSLKSSDDLEANAFYMRLEPYFSPLYRALSYARNREGFRSSVTFRKIPVFSQSLNLSLYAKKLSEIKPTWNEAITEWHRSLAEFLVANGALNIAVFYNWRVETSYEFRKTDRADDGVTLADERIDEQTQIASLSLTYEFTMQTKLMIKYQYVKQDDRAGQGDYIAHIPIIQFSTKF